MRISLIVAAARNGVIGRDGRLPWHLPEDLKRFKAITLGHPVVMGRKTFESIGSKPLPGRTNLVISRSKAPKGPAPQTPQRGQPPNSPKGARSSSGQGASLWGSLEEALEACETAGAGEVFVIGGAEIFQQALPLAERIYLTRVEADIEGDTFFGWDPRDWKETAREEHLEEPLPYRFLTLERKLRRHTRR